MTTVRFTRAKGAPRFTYTYDIDAKKNSIRITRSDGKHLTVSKGDTFTTKKGRTMTIDSFANTKRDECAEVGIYGIDTTLTPTASISLANMTDLHGE